jgi:hypothetical protein
MVDRRRDLLPAGRNLRSRRPCGEAEDGNRRK